MDKQLNQFKGEEVNISEIVIFSYGDGYKSSTWSNIPYFLIKTLENKGYTVRNINLERKKSLISIIYSVYYIILCKIKKKKLYITFDRTRIYDFYANRIMKKTVKLYPNAKCFISTSFSFNPYKYTNKPCLMLCDWDIEYSIIKISGREVDRMELSCIKRQKKYLLNSNLNITLFKDVEDYYKDKEINMKCIGNVINLPDENIEDSDLIKKFESNHVLFIGKEKYSQGLDALIKSLDFLNRDITIDVIGMNRKNQNKSVNYYGYLNKDIETEYRLYIDLIKNSKIIINTNEIWAGFSSIIECMSCYTPVIISKFDTFIDMFGLNINFGFYSDNKLEMIASNIEKIFNLSFNDYKLLAYEAHKKTKNFT